MLLAPKMVDFSGDHSPPMARPTHPEWAPVFDIRARAKKKKVLREAQKKFMWSTTGKIEKMKSP